MGCDPRDVVDVAYAEEEVDGCAEELPSVAEVCADVVPTPLDRDRRGCATPPAGPAWNSRTPARARTTMTGTAPSAMGRALPDMRFISP